MDLHTIRLAGVALPLFSLRGAEDLGSGTILDLIPFVDWCAGWGLRVLQLLPINEAAPLEASPYKALSVFAIDPSYITVLQLPEVRHSAAAQAWLATEKVQERQQALGQAARRDRKLSYGINVRLLEFAFAEMQRAADAEKSHAFEAFCDRHAAWLNEYALFRALSERASFRDWETWPVAWHSYESARHDSVAARLAERVRFAKYVQWVAWEQWQQAHAHAHRRGVLLKGDLAFVCGANSADVWANPDLFDLRSSAGTPPDAFSETGQLWELPVYNWEAMRRSDYAWWRRRAKQAGELYDVFRVDHVVGLYRTYAIPVRQGGPQGFVPAEEARQRQQGHEVLQAIQREAETALVVGEDLGTVPDWVRESLQELRIPGYKVFRWEQRDGQFLDPLTYPLESIATTGTHDTDTLVEWWSTLPHHERVAVCQVLDGASGDPSARGVPWQALMQRLLESPAAMVIIPFQDLMGWSDRINVPATVGDHNWSYRLPMTIAELQHDGGVRATMRDLQARIQQADRS